jgi:cyclase
MTGFRLRILLVRATLLVAPFLAALAAPSGAEVIRLGLPQYHRRPGTIDSSVAITVDPLAPGVYAAKVSYVWTGWVELPDGILVIDTGFNEMSGRALADTIRARSGPLPIKYVVNTHEHADHTGGDRYFGALGATFVVHKSIVEEIKHSLTWAPGEVGDTLSHLGKVPTVKGIERRISYGGPKRPVQVMSLGHPAHTAGDLVVYLPKQKILFAGDLVSYKSVPWLLDPGMNVNGWLKSLDSLLTPAFQIEALVPGHGVRGTPLEEIQFANHYLLDAREKAAKVAGWGTSVESVKDWGYLGPYEGMEFYEDVHYMNMRRLYNEAKGIKTPGRKNVRAIKRT